LTSATGMELTMPLSLLPWKTKRCRSKSPSKRLYHYQMRRISCCTLLFTYLNRRSIRKHRSDVARTGNPDLSVILHGPSSWTVGKLEACTAFPPWHAPHTYLEIPYPPTAEDKRHPSRRPSLPLPGIRHLVTRVVQVQEREHCCQTFSGNSLGRRAIDQFCFPASIHGLIAWT
jgi:hypothetical protein